eukprot:CAMPEP_0178899388 /NCGR_PEP_ID=MMETSP0786-20121207/2870_1 /TAXON_ID=186022 /ORGANISM="Thalassionema frauenfeldii, Strain CCMP 1798" /LENGTH=102 /DNA_ID=CAMNT_0020570235 /DNA_START=439 /DNA_END=747 /DNA_ORIENTATION=+
MKAILQSSHADIVRSICPLPNNGGILTAGGKMDATVRLWDTTDIMDATSGNTNSNTDIVTTSEKLDEPGYVFDLKVLPDSNDTKEGVFAIAAARYNVIKIVV